MIQASRTFGKVDQQATEIVGCRRIDRQDVARGEERLVGIGLRRIGRGRCRHQDVRDVPVEPVTEIGDGVAERLQNRDAGIVDVVVRPLIASGLLRSNPMPSRRSS